MNLTVLKAPVRIGVIFKHLRKLMDSLLEKKLENPKMNLEGDGRSQRVRFITGFRGIVAKRNNSDSSSNGFKTVDVVRRSSEQIQGQRSHLSTSAAGERTIQMILELITSEHAA